MCKVKQHKVAIVAQKSSSKYPSAAFIDYLSTYAPICKDSSQVFEKALEFVTKSKDVELLNFNLPKYEEIKSSVKACIEQRQPKIILLTGSAGDGKTNLMYDICTNTNTGVFNLPEDVWLDAVSNKHGMHTIEYSDCCDYERIAEQDESSKDNRRIHCVHLVDRHIKLYLVKDLSELHSESHLDDDLDSRVTQDKLEVYKVITSIVEEASIGSVPEESDCTFLMIACNNGKLLSFLSRYSDFIERFPDQFVHSEPSTFEKIESLVQDIEALAISQKKFCSEFVALYQVSLCLDREAIISIFKTLLDHKQWHECERGCQYKDTCPILKNCKVLNNDDVIRHIADLLELSSDNGYHVTIRNLLLLIANAILGRLDGDKCRYSCKSAGKKELKGQLSPFDNLLGLNVPRSMFRKKNDAQAVSPIEIFKHLSGFSVGEESNKALDTLLLYNSAADSNDPFVRSALSLIKENDTVNLCARLNAEKEKQTKEDGATVKKKAKDTDKNEIPAILASLRRILFFTLDESYDRRLLQPNGGMSTYNLSNMRYAKTYLDLKAMVNASTCVDRNGMNKVLEQFFVGLNRAFTSLPVLSLRPLQQVYITASNRINPVEFCIIANYERDAIPIDFKGTEDYSVLRIVSSSKILHDSKDMPLLVYYPSKKALHELRNNEHEHSSADQAYRHIESRIGSTRIEEILNEMARVPRFKANCEAKQINLEQMTVCERLKCFYEWLVEAQKYAELVPPLQSMFKDLKLSLKKQHTLGRSNNYLEWLRITPKIFSYLMSLGSGVSSLSLSAECAEEVMAFKAEIERFLSKYEHGEDKSNISKLRFCSLNAEGGIDY